MILPMLLALAGDAPTLEQARTCQAHVAIMIRQAAHDGGHVAGPTWFIRDWWDQAAIDAGASEEGDNVALVAAVTGLEAMSLAEPERFAIGQQICIDTAIEAGAVPGMGPE